MLSTLGYIALLIGAILLIIGYTIEAKAIRPGWACIITALILIVLAYLLPALHTPTYT